MMKLLLVVFLGLCVCQNTFLLHNSIDDEEILQNSFITVSKFEKNGGGFFVVGKSESSQLSNQRYSLLIKMDTEGTIQWTKNFTSTNFVVISVTESTDVAGGFFFVGSVSSNLWILKIDANGELLWSKDTGIFFKSEGKGSQDTVSIAQSTNGAYLFGQITNSSTTTNQRGFFIKINEDGSIATIKNLGFLETTKLISVFPTSDGGEIILGECSDISFFVLKFNAAGNVEWKKGWELPTADFNFISVVRMLQLGNGDYVISGTIQSKVTNAYIPFSVRISSTGEIIWSKKYDFYNPHDIDYYVETYDSTLTSEGKIALTGYTDINFKDLSYNTDYYQKAFLHILSDDGVLEKSVNYKNESIGYQIIVSADGGLMLSFTSDAFSNNTKSTVLAKLDDSYKSCMSMDEIDRKSSFTVSDVSLNNYNIIDMNVVEKTTSMIDLPITIVDGEIKIKLCCSDFTSFGIKNAVSIALVVLLLFVL